MTTTTTDAAKALEAEVRDANPARPLTARIGATAASSYRRGLHADAKFRSSALEHAGRVEEWPAFVKEAYARLYDPAGVRPLPDGESPSPWGLKALSMLERRQGWDELRVAAQAAPSIARGAVRELAEGLGKALGLDHTSAHPQYRHDPRSTQEALEALEGIEMPAEERERLTEQLRRDLKLQAARRHLVEDNLENLEYTSRLSQLVSTIASSAKAKAEAVAALRGFGIGGSDAEGQPDEVPDDLIELCRSTPLLLKILAMAGRMKAAARGGLATMGAGNCDVVGIVPGSDPVRMVPAERVRFAQGGAHGLDARRRLLEGSTQTWELRGDEERNKGDVVILCDRSGSMQGTAIVAARGLAAAALVQARSEGRRVVLVMFDDRAECIVVGSDADMPEALRMLGAQARGGTDVDKAMRLAVTKAGKLRDPDVLLVTDGEFPDVTDATAHALLGKEGRLFAVLVDLRERPIKHADEVIQLTSLTPEGASVRALTSMRGKRRRRKKTTAPQSAASFIDDTLPF